MILSTHILSEVQAVCDRIIIINEGRIVADEKTENIAETVQTSRNFSIKICGQQREVLNALRAVPGVVRADVTGERDLDSYTYIVEAEKGVDIRKPVFYAMSRLGRPIIGMETAQMNLEDVFVRLMDENPGGVKK